MGVYCFSQQQLPEEESKYIGKEKLSASRIARELHMGGNQ